MTVFAPPYSHSARSRPQARRPVSGVKESETLSVGSAGKIFAGGSVLRSWAFNAYGDGDRRAKSRVPAGQQKKGGPFIGPPEFMRNRMTEYEKLWDFQNLYKAHTVARLGKRGNREVIDFEMNLSRNLTMLSDSLRDGSYEMSGYYSFTVHDPKDRVIHALHYRDRVVQHCLCDEVLAPILDRRLIYDNAACRMGKGTHFAQSRVTDFLREFYRKYGTQGYFLKCDIRKFFDSIDHEILKGKLKRVIEEERVLQLLYQIIDSYEKTPGKGLPLGNQTSQWFAIYYLDGMDRLVKEKLHIRYYSRYMDDCVLIHPDKEYLKHCLFVMTSYMREELLLEFNQKTQMFPIRNGADYLGFHFYLTDSGKVIRKVRQQTKYKFKRKLKSMQRQYAEGKLQLEEVRQVLCSYQAHLSHGHAYSLRKTVMSGFVLR